jgi:hypothetical protein
MGSLPAKGTAEVLLRAISKADVGPGDEVWLCVQNPAEPIAAADRGRDRAFVSCEVLPRGPGG